jgi:hypothetical protein
MREILEEKPTRGGGIGRILGVALVSCIFGVLAGANLFPVVEIKFVEKRVEVPVEVIKHVDRVVEKRVVVPVEVIKYVDRMVEKVVEKRVEIPVERIVHRPPDSAADPLDKGHRMLLRGMRKSQVFALIGRPYFDEGNGNLHYYSVSSRMNLRLRFKGDVLEEVVYPK